MEPPQMYDSSEINFKKMENITDINNNNITINHNLVIGNKQQGPSQLSQINTNGNNSNNAMLQKQLLQHYSQSDLSELASQEISMDLHNLIDDQFPDQEALGIFTDLVTSTSNNNVSLQNANHNGSVMTAAKVLQMQQNRMGQTPPTYGRTTLAYMPQPVHTGATYVSNSSDENSSITSDGVNIKEEPMEPQDYRRLAAAIASNGVPFVSSNQNDQVAAAADTSTGIYPLTPNYSSNANNFSTISTPNLHHHHHGLPHLPNQLVNLKHKQIMSQQRKQIVKQAEKGTDEYRKRRERNNIAVRKSREKAKVRSREVEEKVKALIKEKEGLHRRLEEMSNEIQLHKQIYVHLMNHSNPDVNNICRNVLSLASNEHGM